MLGALEDYYFDTREITRAAASFRQRFPGESCSHHPQAKVALEGLEVTVAMEKVMAPYDTKHRNNCIDSLADRHSTSSQRAMVARGGKRHILADHRTEIECRQKVSRTAEISLVAKALKYLDQYEVSRE